MFARVGEAEHKYAIINVNSGKALDLWTGVRVMMHGSFSGGVLAWYAAAVEADCPSRRRDLSCGHHDCRQRRCLPVDLAALNVVSSSAWRNIYVLDHQGADESTDGRGFVRIPVSQPAFGVAWQCDVFQRR